MKNAYSLIFGVIVILGSYGCGSSMEKEIIISEDGQAIVDFIDCEYELLPKNKKGILARFNALSEQGKTDGFYPLIIIPTDTLSEKLALFSEDNPAENADIPARRQSVIDAANEIDGRAFLSSRFEEELEPYKDLDLLGRFVPSTPKTSLNLYMLEYTPCEEVIIAKIPIDNPWELAAWVPMGGFNDCPAPAEQAAVFRYWYEEYGAVPAVVTYDTWQFILTKPPATDTAAEALAKEQFAFCPDSVVQGAETIRGLASLLKNAPVWFLWWD